MVVLEFLRDFDHLERIVQRWGAVERSMSMIGAFASFCCDSVGNDVAKQLDLSSEPAKVLLAEQIFTNTAQTIPINRFTKYRDFLDSYTGSSIRWDTLGIFFTACGLCCNMMTCDERELDFVGHREEDRQSLVSVFTLCWYRDGLNIWRPPGDTQHEPVKFTLQYIFRPHHPSRNLIVSFRRSLGNLHSLSQPRQRLPLITSPKEPTDY